MTVVLYLLFGSRKVERTVQPWPAVGEVPPDQPPERSDAASAELRRVFSWLGIAPSLANVVGPVTAGPGITATLAEVVYWINGGDHWAVVVLALTSIFSGGLSTYKKGWIALKNRNLNINALMSIAVTGAMAIGHWPEAAMVMFLFALAEVIEAKSLDRKSVV